MGETRFQAAIFGPTSAIATETLRALVASRTARLLLVGRNEARLKALAADLSARGAECLTWVADLLDPSIDWQDGLRQRAAGKPWDMFLLAHGSLPDQHSALADGNTVARTIDVNFTSHAVITSACAAILEQQQRGTLAVIGSVAGDRGRQSNFLYGSAKAAIATFAAGLRHRFADTPDIRIVLLKPGMTDTPMTAGIAKGPLFSPADLVGRLAWKAIQRGKAVAYLPGKWRWIMWVIRNLPATIFHRTKL